MINPQNKLFRWHNPPWSAAFSLVELMVVMTLITILSLITIPAISATMMAGSVNQAVTEISLSIGQARAYAMAHNTYVWVGLAQLQRPVQN
jgi:prepilin-type N-terminal cleavage/methylation domain-containing protein